MLGVSVSVRAPWSQHKVFSLSLQGDSRPQNSPSVLTSLADSLSAHRSWLHPSGISATDSNLPQGSTYCPPRTSGCACTAGRLKLLLCSPKSWKAHTWLALLCLSWNLRSHKAGISVLSCPYRASPCQRFPQLFIIRKPSVYSPYRSWYPELFCIFTLYRVLSRTILYIILTRISIL